MIGRREREPERRIIHGLTVLVSDDPHGSSRDHLIGKITAALDLVASYRPRQLRRMRGDMVVWLREHKMCRAALYPAAAGGLPVCVLDTYFVGTFAEQQIASSLVHEGVHARLRRAGVPWTTDQSRRAREERMCRQAELRLGLAMPNGHEVAKRARISLLLDDDAVAPRLA